MKRTRRKKSIPGTDESMVKGLEVKKKKMEYSRKSKKIVTSEAWCPRENTVPSETGKMGKGQGT